MIPSAAPTRLSSEESTAIADAMTRVMGKGQWILGPDVERFESEFARYLGGGHVIGVGNGTDALVMAFTALDLPPGSGILVGANEGGYAATAARLAGLEPVVMDIEEYSMGPTPDLAEAAMQPTVAAIVVTHLHGEATDIRELDEWRRDRGLVLVEDCAQAHGARIGDRSVGLTGDAGCFSFYPTKNLGALGDAGAVVFNDKNAAERAKLLREYGWSDRFRVELERGRNSRLDSLQAAILSARLPFLDLRNERRRVISARYRAALNPALGRLHGDATHTVAHHAVVVTRARDELASHLERHGIATSVHYPYLLTEMPGLSLRFARPTPTATRLRNQILSLPCFPELSNEEVDHVVDALKEWQGD